MIAPPWITVPPPGYGGIESVVALLCDELVARGHDVTLFAAPGSRSRARVRVPLESDHPHEIGVALHESDHVGRAFDEVDRAAAGARPFDVIHDHCGFTAIAMASRASAPLVHTLHGPFSEATRPFYERHGQKARLVAISESQRARAPRPVGPVAVVPNPIMLADWPLSAGKQDYLLWMGRMDPVKGAHRAIAVARSCRRRLLLAGPVQRGQEEYFREQVEPQIDGRQIVFVGEVRGEHRKQLFARAQALLMPIRWAEPFGMVMVEALACGTPVIAFPEGAASEIVIDGENGFHVRDERAMVDAVARLGEIDPLRCRASVAARFDVAAVVERYEAVYRLAAASRRRAMRRQRRAHAGRAPDHAEPVARRSAGAALLAP